MAEETLEVHEIEKIVPQKGKLRVGWAGRKYPVPVNLARVTKAYRYFMLGMITTVAASSLFTAHQSAVFTFWGGSSALLSGTLDIIFGIEPVDSKQTK